MWNFCCTLSVIASSFFSIEIISDCEDYILWFQVVSFCDKIIVILVLSMWIVFIYVNLSQLQNNSISKLKYNSIFLINFCCKNKMLDEMLF